MSGWQESGKFKTTLTEVKNEWCSYPLIHLPEITYEWDSYDDFKRPYEESFTHTVVFKHENIITEFKQIGAVSVYVNDKNGERFERWYNVPDNYYWDETTDCVWMNEYEVKEYDLKTFAVKKYKVILEEEYNMSRHDLDRFEVLKLDKDEHRYENYQPMTDEAVQEMINKEKETHE